MNFVKADIPQITVSKKNEYADIVKKFLASNIDSVEVTDFAPKKLNTVAIGINKASMKFFGNIVYACIRKGKVYMMKMKEEDKK